MQRRPREDAAQPDDLQHKKRPVVEGEERTAPTYNFESSHKLTFTTFLLLTLDTQANRERKIGKRTLLKREHTAAELLPLAQRGECT